MGAGRLDSSLSVCFSDEDGIDSEAVGASPRSDSLVASGDVIGRLAASKLGSPSVSLMLLVVRMTLSPKSKSAKLPLNPSFGGCIIVALWTSSNSFVKLCLRG